MADTQTKVLTLDIQLLDAERSNATTIKLDNPKEDITREQVSAAMQPAFSAGWFRTNNGNTAMYLGDVTISQSIKTKLGGEDFYVTPDSLTLNQYSQEGGKTSSGTITVSGATIQGYDIIYENEGHFQLTCKIANNGLSIDITVSNINIPSSIIQSNAKVNLIIAGTVVPINVYVLKN